MNDFKTKPQVLIVDNHEIFADGIKRILESNLDLKVNTSLGNGEHAFHYFKEGGDADLILFNHYMPQMNDLEFLEYIKEEKPGIKILVASMHPSETNIFVARKLGAHGFIGKDSSLKDMLQAVQDILDGDYYYPETGKSLGTVDQVDHALKRLCKQFNLSRTELKILEMLLDQKKNKEIAHELHLSPLTVKSHRKNIYCKFEVESLAGIVFILEKELGGCK
ncbi:DNA-binding response regulator [Cyclobacteriaceae bacterium YHN15]|nr:DNA-binding response regulator [Cyclobacteriaceae bacterium YHN15]